MERSNDSLNRNIVLCTFLMFYIYLNYIFTQLKREKNWRSVKCNPLEMVIGSIFHPEDSIKQFETCMQYAVSSEQEDDIQKYTSKIDNELLSKINNLNKGTADDTNATNNLLDNTANEINNLKNESLDNETTINDFKKNIQQLTDKVNDTYYAFRDSSNNLLFNLKL